MPTPPWYSESSIPLLGRQPQKLMKNFFSEPVLSLTSTIVVFLLAFTGSIFMWLLSYLYGDGNNLQFGHLLNDNKTRSIAVRNLVIASVFYGILAILMVYELILHLKQSRRQSWDNSIAMVNVHTPKPANSSEAAKKRHTPTLSTSTVPLDESQAGRFRGTAAGAFEPK